MNLKVKLNTYSKKLLMRIFFKFHMKIFTKSDFSKNGLKPYLLDFFLLQSNGVLHVGGHTGQEASFYSRFNLPVIWVEGNPVVFDELKSNVSRFGQRSVLALISEIDKEQVPFYLTSNNSESASVFPLAENHAWSKLENTGSISLETSRLDTLFSEYEIQNYDFWVIDVQGSELQALRSAGKLLQKFCHFALVEISTDEFYFGGSSWSDVVSEMNHQGFIQLWNPTSAHEEILFVNSRFTI